MNPPNKIAFDFHEIQRATRILFDRLEFLLGTSEVEEVRDLSAAFQERKMEFTTARPLIISFIGGYNAGKSTLVRALTGDQSIVIDSDVCTTTVAPYDWDGLSLRDTPGLLAGDAAHDEKTSESILESDLLVFVITAELFDEGLAGFFRELAFEQQRAASMMLVVNKIDQDTGTLETKREDIEKVTFPCTLEAFSTVFVSGKVFLESLRERDSETCEELERLSNFSSFVSSLNSFVARGSQLGRFVAPLVEIQNSARSAKALLSAKDAARVNEVKIWNYLSRQLSQSRSRLADRLHGRVAAFRRKIVDAGKQAAASVSVSVSKEELESKINECKLICIEADSTLRSDMEYAFDEEWKRLASIFQGRQVVPQLECRSLILPTQEELSISTTGPLVDNHSENFLLAFGIQNPQKFFSDKLPKIGKMLSDASTGAYPSDNLTGRTGSLVHGMVKDIGHKRGHSFVSWDICKIADKFYKTGKFLEAHGGKIVVGIGAVTSAYFSWRAGAEGKRMREEILSLFSNQGAERVDFAKRWIDDRLNETYTPIFDEVEEQVTRLDLRTTASKSDIEPFEGVISEVKSLLERIHQNHALLLSPTPHPNPKLLPAH